MKYNFFILFAMVFLHIIDDFKLQQGVLTNLKQKNWWRAQPQYKEMYKYDYIPALVEHAFSWSFMVMLPIAFVLHFDIGYWVFAYLINTAIHAFIDDLKANKFKINLVTDQCIHLIQIFVTWCIFVCTR